MTGHADEDVVFRVQAPGLLTTVQDMGRRAWRQYGFGRSGALDRGALARANRLVGNEPGAAGLEITIAGPRLLAVRQIRVGLAGGDLGAVVALADAPDRPGRPFPVESGRLLQPGEVLRFAGRRHGARAYLAVPGGVDVPPLGGSRATDLVAGVGGLDGRALRIGDEIRALGRDEVVPARSDTPGTESTANAGDANVGTGASALESVANESDSLPRPIRVRPGPDLAHFGDGAFDLFVSRSWTVTPASNRTGMRLDGEPLPLSGKPAMLSAAVVPGTVQVAGDGRPILLLADAQTMGGYPRIAVVLEADLDALAQRLPGDTLRFRLATHGEARRSCLDYRRLLGTMTMRR